MEHAAILELGVEDLPSSMVKDALGQLKRLGESLLKNYRITYKKILTSGSSRRLILYVGGIRLRQEDAIEKDMGPPKNVVYGPDGKLTQAGRGYLEAKGVSAEDLGIQTTDKGEYVYIKKHIKGEKTSAILPTLFKELVRNLKFPKSMRWKEGNFSFGRPLRYILSLLDNEVVEFEVDGIRSGRKTKGHRYLNPQWFDVPDISSYWNIIQKAHVIANPEKRKEKIIQQTSKVISKLKNKGYEAQLNEDEELLEELGFLAEYPTVFWGEFDSMYLSLPSFILKACLREYQKYFTITDGNKVLPFFIGIREGGKHNLEEIVENNKRVLHARLNDAQFFYKEDKKIPLEERVPKLKGVIVQEKLGSYYDKVKRLVTLSERVCSELKVEDEVTKKVKRAAYLCKADILTNMGKEFPTLQGMLGKEYALHSGEDPLVAKAIEEHRKPRFSGDELPKSLEGAILAIVDKIDTLAGAFWAGFIPSGSEDPWGLRREAQGIVEIIINREFNIALNKLINESIILFGEEKEDSKEKLGGFLNTRVVVFLRDMGITPDQINAIMQVDKNNLVDIVKRAKALRQLVSQKEFEEEVVATVRVLNILRQAKNWGIKIPSKINEERFEEKEEMNLHRHWENIKGVVDSLLDKGEYVKAYKKLSSLKGHIHTFFDKVLVMSENQDMRLNRLSLLSDIGSRFLRLADFTKLQI